MANSATVTNSGSYTNGTETWGMPGVTAKTVSIAGNPATMGVLTVNNADTTIPLGNISGTLGVYSFKNLDSTNTINIKHAAAGTVILSILPGECWQGRFGSGVTAPVAISSASTPLLEYFIAPA